MRERGGGARARIMTDFLAGDERGEGFGVEVRASIPPAGMELREDTAAHSFPRAGSPEAVRLKSWEELGISDISRISSRMLTALLTAWEVLTALPVGGTVLVELLAG